MIVRVGIGVDTHRLAARRRLVLGGVEIPSDVGLDGHSDADVLTHAIVDALLGALALGDVGRHFPDDDPRWKDADSRVFLREATRLVHERGFRISNVDASIVAERPKLAPFVDRMRRTLAETMDVEWSYISVKATTAERMGAIGRREGIAALAVVTVASDLGGSPA